MLDKHIFEMILVRIRCVASCIEFIFTHIEVSAS